MVCRFKCALFAVGLSFTGAASAQQTINSSDNGWYLDNGVHGPTNTNTYSGEFQSQLYRGFWQFDLTGLVPASSISITFLGNNGTFETDTGSETIALFDFTGSVATLLNGTGGLAAYNDLGTGSLLGGHTITAADGSRMPEFTVALSSAFVSQFNSALGSSDPRIALGAASQTALIGGAWDGFWIASGVTPAARLNITTGAAAVPEPESWAMMLLGFAAIGFAHRRRAKGVARKSVHA